MTLHELDTSWSLDDVLEANDVLDALEDAMAEAQRIAEERARR